MRFGLKSVSCMNKQDLINFELRVKEAWERGEIKAPLHLSGGNEDALIEIFKEINPNDYVFSTHRNHYHALLHGISPGDVYNEIIGDENGCCKGRARSMGYISHKHNFYSSAIVGGCCAIAVGTAWALKAQNKPDIKVFCFVGDGALDGGHFWESLQYAHGWDLPITFVIEDNDRSTCTSVKDRLGTTRGEWRSTHIIHYAYKPDYPHVGSGKYVQF